jgi:hypothetical protein
LKKKKLFPTHSIVFACSAPRFLRIGLVCAVAAARSGSDMVSLILGENHEQVRALA